MTMGHHTREWAGVAVGAAVILAAAGCRDIPRMEPAPERTTAPAVITLESPPELGPPERPPVEFDHEAHVAALPEEGCARCHPDDGGGEPSFAGLDPGPAPSRGELMERAHDRCESCHAERRRAGSEEAPVLAACASCHARRPDAVSERVAIRFDRSLHHRHVQAAGDRCETCHHVLDRDTGELVYARQEEEACATCHGPRPDGDTPALRDAAHQRCVTCHLRRREEGVAAGPTSCAGCHDAEVLAHIAVLDDVPRLDRGQPDRVLLDPGPATAAVPFDHAAHEGRTTRCSVCHHATLGPCGDCHDDTGLPDGGGVTREEASHLAASDRSCVGCHDERAHGAGCAGCHAALPTPPSEGSCAICHATPPPPAAAPPAEMLARAGGEEPPEDDGAPAPAMAPLPPASDAFPATVTIDGLAGRYGPAELPHRAMVERLDGLVRESALASAFHAGPEVTCAGCHHHTPVGDRPPPCASCHGPADRLDEDRPSLEHAYHRQCIECHQQMEVGHTGCTDCHEEAEEGPS